MKMSRPIVATLFLIATSVTSAQAAFPAVDSLVLGSVMDGLLVAAGASGVAKQYKVVRKDPTRYARVQILQHLLTNLPNAPAPLRIAIVKGEIGDEGTAAFCSGATIYLSTDLMDRLNDKQLFAVIAHETAHATLRHPLKLAVTPLGAVIRDFIAMAKSDLSLLTGDGLDAYMRKFLTEKYIMTLKTEILKVQESFELEADCVAGSWLAELQRQGFANQPKNLLSAMRALLGYDPLFLPEDDIIQQRAVTIARENFSACQ